MAGTPITDWVALTAHELAATPGEAAGLMAQWNRVSLAEARHKQADLLEAGLLESSPAGIRLSRAGRAKLDGYVRALGHASSPETG